MNRLMIAIGAAACLALPAASLAQDGKGKSLGGTRGHSEHAPGHSKEGTAKEAAPGQRQKTEGGSARDYAPGQKDKAPNGTTGTQRRR
jgi:hypothetical protein